MFQQNKVCLEPDVRVGWAGMKKSVVNQFLPFVFMIVNALW